MYNKFDFIENTSVFNNNYIKLRFRNIPVLGIKSNSPFFDVNDESKTNIELSSMSILMISLLKQIMMYHPQT